MVVLGEWFLVARWVVAATLALALFYRARLKVSWPWVCCEVALAAACYLVYFLVRGMTAGQEAVAAANADRLIDIERNLGLFQEDHVQALVIHHRSLVTAANWAYIWGHWPFIVVVGAWLMVHHPHAYVVTRNTFVLSGALGLVVFATFPVAPPRLLDLGLVDTVTEHSHAYKVLQPPAFTNQFAAMPSLHFGWNLLVGIALVRVARGRLRLLGLVSPAVILFAVIATGNHFLIDAVAGGALCLAALLVVERWGREVGPSPRALRTTPLSSESTS